MITFIFNKIKRYGILGIIRYTYIKYTAELFYNCKFGKLIRIRHHDYKIFFSHTNVAKALYLFRNLHDGDVDEIKDLLKPGDTFIDIGANIGTITIPLSKYIGDNGKIIAIEAHPNTYTELRRNIKLNHLNNVQTFQIAIGDYDGIIRFSNIKFDDMNHIITDKRETNYIEVPIIRLDTLFKNIEKIDVMKIDVEGYEKLLLEHATETLSKTKAIYIEYFDHPNNHFNYKREIIKEILENNGFECSLSDVNKHQNPDIDNLICINKRYK